MIEAPWIGMNGEEWNRRCSLYNADKENFEEDEDYEDEEVDSRERE